MSHYEQRLQRDLDKIRGSVASLAADVQRAISNALRAVQTGNEKLAYNTILEDGRINRAHREINKQCYRFIARHLPSAGPLRLIEATVRASIQFERLGDYAVTISREAIQMSQPPDGIMARELDHISSNAIRMLEQAIDAFNDNNDEKARATMLLATDVERTLDVVYSSMMAEADRAGIKNLLAMFVVFNMVKRVSDQAKNICEETLFAVSGEYKQDARHRILFVDEDGTCLGPMAEAIARRMYGDSAKYESASHRPGDSFDPAMTKFMEDHGFDLGSIEHRQLDPSKDNINQYFVVVSLQGPVKSFIPNLPFHTSALEWDVGPAPVGMGDDEADTRLQELYREISGHVRDLMRAITGKEES